MSQRDIEPSHLETLDRDLGRVSSLELATAYVAKPLVAPAVALIFIVLVGVIAASTMSALNNAVVIVIAAVLGAYMALNIGANDVANNMGPAVGSKALPMIGALAIAGICEAAGAILAGGDVVSTISKGIVTPDPSMQVEDFVLVMMAALLAAAA